MGKNFIPLQRQWGYSLPPGQLPKHHTKYQKTYNNHHAPLDLLCSVELLLQEVLPARHFIVRAVGHASSDMVALQERHLQCHMCKAAKGNNVLLKQPDDEDKPSTLAEDL
jgi:hypothetical protein